MSRVTLPFDVYAQEIASRLKKLLNLEEVKITARTVAPFELISDLDDATYFLLRSTKAYGVYSRFRNVCGQWTCGVTGLGNFEIYDFNAGRTMFRASKDGTVKLPIKFAVRVPFWCGCRADFDITTTTEEIFTPLILGSKEVEQVVSAFWVTYAKLSAFDSDIRLELYNIDDDAVVVYNGYASSDGYKFTSVDVNTLKSLAAYNKLLGFRVRVVNPSGTSGAKITVYTAMLYLVYDYTP